MGIYFFDSSAIAKHYVAEKGTNWVGQILHPSAHHRIHVARISGVEVISAITKRIRIGSIDPSIEAAAIARFRSDFMSRPRIDDISALVIDRAMNLAERHGLRAYDAVQLAAAVMLHEGCRNLGLKMILVSSDLELNATATAEGLAVENPETHP